MPLPSCSGGNFFIYGVYIIILICMMDVTSDVCLCRGEPSASSTGEGGRTCGYDA